MHSNIPDAIMFPYYRGYSQNIKLHNDDIAAIRRLYGGRRTFFSTNTKDKAFLCLDPPSGIPSSPPSDLGRTAQESSDMTSTTTDELPTNFIETTTIRSTHTTTETTLVTSPITTVFSTTETSTITPIYRYTTTLPISTSTRSPPRISAQESRITPLDQSKLDLCDGFYDAITMYKGVLFIFKGQVRFHPIVFGQ
jgi:hypothetical protein